MKIQSFFTGLFLLFSLTAFSQATQRKLAQKTIVKKIRDYVFTSKYEPYFVNDDYSSIYGADDQWFYDFEDGNLIVHRLQETSADVKALHKWVVDILRLDTSRIFYDYKNYGNNIGKKKYKNLGSIEYRIGEKYHYTESGVTYDGEGKLIDMDFENYAQFTSFCFELRSEWRKAAAVLVHVKALQAMDKMDLENYGRPYIIRLLNDSLFEAFKSELPYIQKARLVTEFKDQSLYSLIIISKSITRKTDFIKEYYKYNKEVNVWDAQGFSPLMLCVANYSDTATLSLLLKLGASPFANSKELKTAYDYSLMVQKANPFCELIIRNAILNGDHSVKTKLEFCLQYKLKTEGSRLANEDAQKYPDSMQVQYQLAAWHYNMKMYTQAVNGYTECIRLRNDDARLYFYRGLCYYALNLNEKATTDFNEAIRLNPSFKNEIETAKKQISDANQ